MENRIVFLDGPRVYLRPLEEADVPRMTRWINDPKLRMFITAFNPANTAKEKQWVASQAEKGSEQTLAICLKENDLHIGNIGLMKIDTIARVATTGTIIGEEEHRGKGYGSEAKMLLLDWAFNRLNLRKVCSSIFATNGRSQPYSEKCGYKVEARLKEHRFIDGQYVDEVLLAVFYEDWLPLWEEFRTKHNL
jgi:RimJ/RimL family protein N-acetyltransferase